MKKISENTKLMTLIAVIFLLVGIMVTYMVYVAVTASKEYTIQGTLTDVWFTDRAINIVNDNEYWITIQLDNGCPTMYFFGNDNIFTQNSRQKAFNAFNQTLLLEGKDIVLTYETHSPQNQLTYFVSIKES